MILRQFLEVCFHVYDDGNLRPTLVYVNRDSAVGIATVYRLTTQGSQLESR
jgi:hypothetical protein